MAVVVPGSIPTMMYLGSNSVVERVVPVEAGHAKVGWVDAQGVHQAVYRLVGQGVGSDELAYLVDRPVRGYELLRGLHVMP